MNIYQGLEIRSNYFALVSKLMDRKNNAIKPFHNFIVKQ